MSNFIRPPLLKGHYSPFSAIFFSLDQVEGYRRVFSLEETSYVFLFLPPTFSYRSPYRPFRSIRHPYVSCSLIHLGIFTSDCNIGTQSMNAFRYRILLSVSLSLYSSSIVQERRVIFHLLLHSGPPSTRRQFHHSPLVVGSS